MITTLLHLVRLLPFLCGGHRSLAVENLALRQQLAVYKRTAPRPKLRRSDRSFFSEAVCQEHCSLVVSAPSLCSSSVRTTDACGSCSLCEVVILLFALSVTSGNSPAHDGDAIGRRRPLGHGSQHQPRTISRSPPIHLVSQRSDRSVCPSSCHLGGPACRQRSTHFGRVIDRPILPDRKEDPGQPPRQRHHGDGPATPAPDPLRPVAQRRRLGSLAPAQNAPRGLDQEPAQTAIPRLGDVAAALDLARAPFAGHQPR